MNNKKKSLLFGIVAVMIASSVATVLLLTDNNTESTSKTKITDVIPGVIVGSGSWDAVGGIADIAHIVVYTIEGTILEFGVPILHSGSSQNRGHAAIPVTMSVDKLYKGELESETFTFYFDSDVWLYPDDFLEGDDVNLFIKLANHERMYPGIDYTDVPKSYSIRYHYEIFEIGDKIIAHFKISDLPLPINYIYEKDYGTIDEAYTIALGARGYYDVMDNGTIYGGEIHNIVVPLNRALTESLP